MTQTVIDIVAYQGKKVKFNLLAGGTATPVEGLIELVNGTAFIFKPKGVTMTKLLTVDAVQPGTLEQVIETPRELKAKRADPLSLSNARAHLLAQHSFELAVVNKLTDEAAYREHELIDHDRLGHFHAAKSLEVDE